MIEKVYDSSYNEYVQDKEGVAVEFAKELRDKKVHYDICKTSHNTQVLEENRRNYLFRFFQESKKQGVVPLPVLLKAKNRKLDLRSYGMSEGVARSLAAGIELWEEYQIDDDDEVLNQIVLDNNSLTDHSTAVILDAISKITDMNQIVIKKNEFHEKSITPLKRILARPFPNQLHELRLVSLRTTAAITTEVC